MLEQVIDKELHKAKNGNADSREQILSAGKPFVLRVVSAFCQRKMEWGRDDELSIGLIAMDEAINRFSPETKVPFLAYARMVIKSRLKDFFRKEAKHATVSLDEAVATGEGDYPHTVAETNQAWDNHIQEVAAKERQEEVLEFGTLLADYGLSYAELVNASPKHRDTRETLNTVAWQLANDSQLIKQLLAKKQMPITELALLTGVNRKTLERRRRYIIALALLIYHRESFIYIYSYLNLTNFSKGVSNNGKS